MSEIRSASEPSIKKAVIYARFSTDLQNERSIEDQITLCRAYASREGINIIEVYEDRARSGGSIMGRGGLLRLLDQARDRSFDVVVVEALDRLSRDMEDLAGIHKRLSFLGIEIRAVHEGVVNTVLVGLRGLVGQLYREDNAHKVRRGLAGRVGQGLNAGGKAYGYAPAVGEKGKRIVVEAEAKIVRRIFEDYVAGRTPREIAYDLNNERISPPRGRSWNASTINGNMQRGTGIIQNDAPLPAEYWESDAPITLRMRTISLSTTAPRAHWAGSPARFQPRWRRSTAIGATARPLSLCRTCRWATAARPLSATSPNMRA
jgi:DNA invertase Pin-like site-specific DNA recombinase